MTKHILVLCCVSLLSTATFAQFPTNVQETKAKSQSAVNIRRDIDLESASKSTQIPIVIENDVERFNLSIRALISEGKLQVALYDPSGEKQGSFTISASASLDGMSEKVRGQLDELQTDPQPGEWHVRVEPQNASGDLMIEADVFQ